MRLRRAAWFGTFIALAGACGGEGGGVTPAGGSCEDALSRLQSCVDARCANGSSKTCESFQTARSGSLHAASSDPCDALTPTAIDRLLTASCDELLAEAGLVLDGKADGDCPPYFPWCSGATEGATGYEVRVLSFEPGLITLEVEVRDLSYASVMLQGQAFHELALDSAGRVPGIGRPTVPSIGLMVGVPGGTDTAWVERFDVLETTVLEDLRLAPLQKMSVEDAPAPEFALDAASYASDAPYPGSRHEVGEIATWRNFRVVRLETYPLQYNAARRELEVATLYRVELRFDDLHAEPVDTVNEGVAAFASAYDETLVNYYEATDDGATPEGPPDRIRYLFVVHDPLLEAIQPLVDLKEEQGVKTEVLLTSNLADGQGSREDRIKSAIRLRYEQHAIEYVLLVGEPEDIPQFRWDDVTYNEWGDPFEEPGPESDVWYGCLAGEDSLPEVSIGRMMGKTPEELSVHVKKTLAHHQATDRTADWRSRVLLVAHEENYPEKYTACSESVRLAPYRSSTVKFSKLYGAENATNEQVIQQINDGLAVLNYRGHGLEDVWDEWNLHNFRVDEAPLMNGDRLPVVFSIACLNSAYRSESPSMAEQWVFHPNGGAVAVLGATRPSYTVPNDDFNRYLFQALLNEGVDEIGLLMNRANAKLFNQYGKDWGATSNMRMYTWLGDPSLRLGEAFDVPPPPASGSVIINEVMASPAEGLLGDTNGDGVREFKADEFVELVNTGAGDADLSGWTVSDRIGTRFTFPEGTVLGAGKALVVFGGGDPATFSDKGGSQVFVASGGLKLNDDGDEVALFDAAMERVDSMSYRAALAKGGSMVRVVDGDGTSPFEQHPGEPPHSPGRKRDGGSF